MAFYGNCGNQVQDGIKFCPGCGNEVAAAPVQQQAQPVQSQQQSQNVQPQQPVQPVQPTAPASDAEANKLMAVLSYIIFFIPLITGDHKKSPFVKYHVNQGIIVFAIGVAYGIISAVLRAVIKVPVTVWGVSTGAYYTPGWLSTILWILSLGIFVLCILGIYNAATGKMKPVPVIGDKITIIK